MVRNGRIKASCANDAMSSPCLGVHRTAHVGHARTDLRALVPVQHPAAQANGSWKLTEIVIGAVDTVRCA